MSCWTSSSGGSMRSVSELEPHAGRANFRAVMPKAFIRANRTVSLAEPPYSVRRSPVHGYGAFADRRIRRGEIIDEYTGERITHEQANIRYRERDERDTHTFLFPLSDRLVIDGGFGGNDTRFINHKCEPNCAPRIRRGRDACREGRSELHVAAPVELTRVQIRGPVTPHR